jgi:hypothetical protein
MKTARQLSKGNRTGSGQNPETMLEIVTPNIEGIKGNFFFFVIQYQFVHRQSRIY